MAALVGGLFVLNGKVYFVLTGLLLMAAAGLMIFRRETDAVEVKRVRLLPAALVGTGTGFVSGLTGVGGGVFLAPAIILFGWASPRQASALSPPWSILAGVILVLGLAGVLLAGQRFASGAPAYAIAALSGAVIGTAIGSRWMNGTQHPIRSRGYPAVGWSSPRV